MALAGLKFEQGGGDHPGVAAAAQDGERGIGAERGAVEIGDKKRIRAAVLVGDVADREAGSGSTGEFGAVGNVTSVFAPLIAQGQRAIRTHVEDDVNAGARGNAERLRDNDGRLGGSSDVERIALPGVPGAIVGPQDEVRGERGDRDRAGPDTLNQVAGDSRADGDRIGADPSTESNGAGEAGDHTITAVLRPDGNGERHVGDLRRGNGIPAEMIEGGDYQCGVGTER